MALFLSEKQVSELLTMSDALQVLEEAFWHAADGEVLQHPRRRLIMPRGIYHVMSAADLRTETFGIKLYTSFPPRTRFLFLLYSSQNGDLLAIIEADKLGQVRTGAATGIATKLLANHSEPLRVGVFGAGWQAETQIEAVCTACTTQQVRVYSRSPERREAFCKKINALLSLDISPAESPEEVVRNSNVIITATNSISPVLQGKWLSPGTHINAIGSNMLIRQELDVEAIRQADLIVVDSIEQARLEAGDLLPAFERGYFRWEQAVELAQIVSGQHPGRTHPDQITLFKSLGIALEDVAVATHIYKKALHQGIGEERSFWAALSP
ncbi:ornithine cyclodeaminase family protein [Chthonomonas calidirosea]|uniref:ornithine cyclodeaminase family protein n=1 Tax=Chthonomonas calidirosea TaxID=454171 RepID=UPI0006ECCE5C|nr:ornithine cyclodeaminase family protein [Chthonomonas calidirosea]CEK14196.1 ornithine cyclodeaminase [Chthonomonas calidirosea]